VITWARRSTAARDATLLQCGWSTRGSISGPGAPGRASRQPAPRCLCAPTLFRARAPQEQLDRLLPKMSSGERVGPQGPVRSPSPAATGFTASPDGDSHRTAAGCFNGQRIWSSRITVSATVPVWNCSAFRSPKAQAPQRLTFFMFERKPESDGIPRAADRPNSAAHLVRRDLGLRTTWFVARCGRDRPGVTTGWRRRMSTSSPRSAACPFRPARFLASAETPWPNCGKTTANSVFGDICFADAWNQALRPIA